MGASKLTRVSIILLMLVVAALAAYPAPKGALQVGAAKVDITPADNAALQMSGYPGRDKGFSKVHDHIYVRSIVLNDGTSSAAIVVWELIGMPNEIWAELADRIGKETGIPRENILLAGVHDHDAPSLAGMYARAGAKPPEQKQIDYTEKVKNAAMEAVRQAKANLQPAKVGYGTGKAYVNINRREYFADKGWYWLGHNPDAPSDKTLAVVKFESLSGKAIAFFINYPVHAVVMPSTNFQISGDLAGATSRFVEQYYKGDKANAPRSDAGYAIRLKPEELSDQVVAIWTSGTAGDQNPTVMSDNEDFTIVDAIGKILGEETVRVAHGITTTPQGQIWGSQREVSCPGRTVEPGQRPRTDYKFTDSPNPVSIRLSLLMINDIALAGMSGEVLTNIGLHLKKDSLFNQTIIVTHANGGSGYVPSDSLFDQLISYENTTSRLKPGCAENAIVNGFLEMMQQH